MIHEPSTKPAPKMSYRDAHKGICSCGWKSGGGPCSQLQAMLNAQKHADTKNAQETE